MPSESQAENRLMHASAEGEPWAVKKVPQSVGKEFVSADSGRKISSIPEHTNHKEHDKHLHKLMP